jgi:hypothetical protein
MSVPGLFTYARGGFYPANGRTQETVRARQFKPYDLVSAQLLTARNPKLNALVQAVLAHLAEGFGVPTETIKTKLKLALGYVDLVDHGGRIEQAPRSFRFEDMDEDAFVEFWRAAEVLVTERLLPELADDEQDQIVEILNGGKR